MLAKRRRGAHHGHTRRIRYTQLRGVAPQDSLHYSLEETGKVPVLSGSRGVVELWMCECVFVQFYVMFSRLSTNVYICDMQIFGLVFTRSDQ